MTENYANQRIRRFVEAFVESREGKIGGQADEVFTVTYPNKTPEEYTYQPAISRVKKIPLLSNGSPAFQQILSECLQNGVLCQILLSPKENYEAFLRTQFRDSPCGCEDCGKPAPGEEAGRFCEKHQPCIHQINNAKIAAIDITKKEPVRYFQFYFSARFQNKLRARNEEILTVLTDEKGSSICIEDSFGSPLKNQEIAVQDFKAKLKPAVFDELNAAAAEKLDAILRAKLVLFDLPLRKEKRAKLKSFDRRLRRERREQVISRKHDFDYPQWRSSYEALLKREEETYQTTVAVKLINLLVINTTKVSFKITLDNNATIQSSFVLGINQPEVACPICKKTFTEGYATQDSLYVCRNCVKQSVDTAKIYSKKAALALDETLKEYIEPASGFVCTVCGKRHSRLLEYKCSHDNSSVCIYHYGLCDTCGKVFSKLNLSYTDEFKRQLCPKHATKEKQGAQ